MTKTTGKTGRRKNEKEGKPFFSLFFEDFYKKKQGENLGEREDF